MKSIHIGDIHGRTMWKDIVKANPDADKIVFHGDYFDSYNNEYTAEEEITNFNEIITLAKADNRVILLMGNHDIHYIPAMQEQYSRFQPRASREIWNAMKENLDMLKACYITKDFICSHAGIAEPFLERVNILNDENLEDNLNYLLRKNPRKFRFDGWDGYGDDITQGPMWIRPNSLLNAGIKGTHIVGHSMCPLIRKTGKDPYAYFIDVLGTRGEYLECDNGEFKVKSI